MKNPRALLFALAVAVVAGIAQWRYVAGRERALLWQSAPMATLVALQDVPAHFRLDETLVEVVDVPQRWRQPRALASVEDILGQITAAPILQGEQVVSTKLVRADDAGLAYFVQKKHRAVTLAADDLSTLGGHLKPGNAVDVVGTFDFGQGETSDMRTVTLFQNVRVLAVGSDVGRPTPATIRTSADLADPGSGSDLFGAERHAEAHHAEPSRSVTLELTPSEAQKLLLAQELGQLSLTLRSLWEAERFVDLDHATIHTALGVPQQVRYQARPRYRLIQSGGF
ncbi:MAG: Flp pilus assembly protein CpaB [Deltaproteobacteria bacterium]|nr:Flp pilus assembly protein CpaB [Deltaproteobacteria bacterium]